jgi:hypothetical protein
MTDPVAQLKAWILKKYWDSTQVAGWVRANFVARSSITSGEWTPVATFNGSSSGVTYTTQVGTYTRISDRVFCTIQLTLSNNGTGVGDMAITGLPFTARKATFAPAAWTTSTAVISVWLAIFAGGTSILVYRTTAAATSPAALTDVEAGNTVDLVASFSYEV